MASYSASDLAYILAEYRIMGELCDGRSMTPVQAESLVAAGRLPAAASPPPRPFMCWSRSGAGAGVEVDCGWLTSRSPEVTADQARAFAQRSEEQARLRQLAGASAPDDPGWRDALRTAVGELDSLLRPFTDYDRERWGDTSRDRNITRLRDKWPGVLAV